MEKGDKKKLTIEGIVSSLQDNPVNNNDVLKRIHRSKKPKQSKGSPLKPEQSKKKAQKVQKVKPEQSKGSNNVIINIGSQMVQPENSKPIRKEISKQTTYLTLDRPYQLTEEEEDSLTITKHIPFIPILPKKIKAKTTIIEPSMDDASIKQSDMGEKINIQNEPVVVPPNKDFFYFYNVEDEEPDLIFNVSELSDYDLKPKKQEGMDEEIIIKEVKNKGGRPRKYETEEEAKIAKNIQTVESNKRRKNEKKWGRLTQDYLELKELDLISPNNLDIEFENFVNESSGSPYGVKESSNVFPNIPASNEPYDPLMMKYLQQDPTMILQQDPNLFL